VLPQYTGYISNRTAQTMNHLMKAAAVGLVTWGLYKLSDQILRPKFENRIVVITGGSRGLGLALARRFAREGARLALIARTEDDLATARRELVEMGADVLTIAADLTSEPEAERAIIRVVDHFGGVDVLVNNAGMIQVGPFDVMTDQDFRDAMDIHFWSAHYLTRTALPYLEKSYLARIVNITSIGGEIAVPHLAPYVASKFALVGYSDTLRAELAPKNIRVTTVSPGLMRTGSHVNALFKGQREKEYAWFSILSGNPLLSTSADSAARKIVEACRFGRPSLIITIPARLAKAAEGIAPNTVARVNKLVNRLLPDAENGEMEAVPGREATSAVSPSPLTFAADRNVERFNEKRS
jgi:NAD(P)-dependent dehydrogenase (short-subunit alcohol dehydrogenase family)